MKQVDRSAAGDLKILFDAAWYVERYKDVQGTDPLHHYVTFGANEGRDPNPFFDGGWYRAHYQDVAQSGIDSLLHYMVSARRELRNPHPRFDAPGMPSSIPRRRPTRAAPYAVRRARGWATEPRSTSPTTCPPPPRRRPAPTEVRVDVIVPVYRGLAETQRCLKACWPIRTARPGG